MKAAHLRACPSRNPPEKKDLAASRCAWIIESAGEPATGTVSFEVIWQHASNHVDRSPWSYDCRCLINEGFRDYSVSESSLCYARLTSFRIVASIGASIRAGRRASPHTARS